MPTLHRSLAPEEEERLIVLLETLLREIEKTKNRLEGVDKQEREGNKIYQSWKRKC